MTHSEAYMNTKFVGFHPSITNDYLLKHGNYFLKAEALPPQGFLFPPFSDIPPFPLLPGMPFPFQGDVKYDALPSEIPMDFAIKQEKPTPPPSPSTNSTNTSQAPPTSTFSKHDIWLLGDQKFSWDNSAVASYNPYTKMFRCVVCNAVGFLSRIAEHYLGTHTSAKVFQCLHCPYSSTWSRCVRMHMAKHHSVPNAPPSLWKGEPLLEEIFQLLTNLKTTVDSHGREKLDLEVSDKKFSCRKCPYTTDRRDLFLRHENIHKEDKPYHCYICFKLFNRADHVKKHFLRMHRGHQYDISLVRRRPPRSGSSAANTTPTSQQTIPSNFTVDKLIAPGNDSKPSNDVKAVKNPDVPPKAPSAPPPKKTPTFRCPHCKWEGYDEWSLKNHMSVHFKTFGCPNCGHKARDAEKLFAHVYQAHNKFICTKCKFVSQKPNIFDMHLRECCVEYISPAFDKKLKESHTMQINESHEREINSQAHTNEASNTPPSYPKDQADTAIMFPNQLASNVKGSVSLMPLHNSVSYYYSPPQFTSEHLNSLNIIKDNIQQIVNGEMKPPSTTDGKIESKPDLSSPAQSSSDSGVADLTGEQNDIDLSCKECGCEFANESSMETHMELYHREEVEPSSSSKPNSELSNKLKKFSCTVCNFTSDKQKTIMEHMRYHTGEMLFCQADSKCAFKTVCDSILEKHVQVDHADEFTRCPHCGLHCIDKVSFIRHYRKCHHSSSCSRCKVIKHSLNASKHGNEKNSKKESNRSSGAQILPYLHHNPYSRKSNAITPYSHCNAAMSKVAVAIPQALQKNVGETTESLFPFHSYGHKSRKQSVPRKLVHVDSSQLVKPASSETLNETFCDTNKSLGQGRKRNFVDFYKKKLLKAAKAPPRSCRMSHPQGFHFKNNVNFVRHQFWSHLIKRHCCGKCNMKFKYQYQLLFHKKKHEFQGITPCIW